MKKTGRRVYLSGEVSSAEATAIATNGGADVCYFQNILVDERRGYAYKVTFISSFPSVTLGLPVQNVPFALQSFSRRELLRMSNDELLLHSGRRQALGAGSLAASNRTIGIYGLTNDGRGGYNASNYQNQYVVKGDAMVTQSLSIAVDMEQLGPTDSATTYYIELDEYEVSSDEEILLILNERAQDAAGLGN